MKKLNFLTRLIGSIRFWLIARKILRTETTYGGEISVFDHLSPEANAVVQSLNSRSAGGFIKNLKKICTLGFKKIMATFYSGYGHKSIADCGSTTSTLDGVSMLCAKALQDWPLYNGQETSTRYVDVTGLGYIDPISSPLSQAVMKRWFDFYIKSLKPTIKHLKEKRPLGQGEDIKKWESTLEKRAYDILGAFLPAGTKTNVSGHMTLRQWDDKLSYMVHDPVDEISLTAVQIMDLLKKKYPSTFVKPKSYDDSKAYKIMCMKHHYNRQDTDRAKNLYKSEKDGVCFKLLQNYLDEFVLKEYRNLAESRPKKTELPKKFNEAGSFLLDFMIDFRSHRDWQRQRSAEQRVPILTMEHGFEKWYLDQLPEDVRKEAENLLSDQEKEILCLSNNIFTLQYYIPMGYRVHELFTVRLADLIYIIELRTPTTVHPTARKIAIRCYEELRSLLPEWVQIYADTSEDVLDLKRADQDLFIGNQRVSEIKH